MGGLDDADPTISYPPTDVMLGAMERCPEQRTFIG
jgi:hypothetical protein